MVVSSWKRIAIERLPKHKSMIERAKSPMALWINLWCEFTKSFEAGDMEGVHQTMAYARYCLSAPSDDVRTAAAYAFIEHLPTNKGIKAVLPDLLTAAEFCSLKHIISYHVGEGVTDEIEQDYRRKNDPFIRSKIDAQPDRRKRRSGIGR